MDNPQDRGQWTSASSAAADQACPGRHLAQKGIPELPSDAAEFGTVVHKSFETGDDSELAVSVEWIVERARELENEAVGIVFGENRPNHVYREKRFWHHKGELSHSGQCDVVYIGDRAALVLDLKSLRGRVAESPSNPQLRDLAVLAWANYDVESVFVGIIQPMLKGKPLLTEYSRQHLRLAHLAMWERVEKSNDPKAQRVPGEVQCKFCRAFFRCIEGQIWLKESLPATTGTKDDLKSRALALPLDKAVELWRKSTAIKTILDANAERLKAASDEELAAVGLKKKPGVSREKIVKPNELYARLTQHNVTVQEYTAIVGVPKGKFQELVKAKTGLKGKNLEKLCDDLLEGLTEITVGAEGLEEIQ